MKMHVITILGILGFMLTSWGQQPEGNFNRERAPGARAFRAQGFRNWLGNHINDQEFLKKAGIENEQAEVIKTESAKLDAKMKELDEKIEQAALQQAELSRKILAEPGAEIDEVIKIIETISQYRLEQSKLSFQNLVLIRDNLSEEQRKKAQDLIMEEGRRRFAERAAAGGMRGQRGEGAAPAGGMRGQRGEGAAPAAGVRGQRGEGEGAAGRADRPGAAGQHGGERPQRGGARGDANQARPAAPQGW